MWQVIPAFFVFVFSNLLLYWMTKAVKSEHYKLPLYFMLIIILYIAVATAAFRYSEASETTREFVRYAILLLPFQSSYVSISVLTYLKNPAVHKPGLRFLPVLLLVLTVLFIGLLITIVSMSDIGYMRLIG